MDQRFAIVLGEIFNIVKAGFITAGLNGILSRILFIWSSYHLARQTFSTSNQKYMWASLERMPKDWEHYAF